MPKNLLPIQTALIHKVATDTEEVRTFVEKVFRWRQLPFYQLPEMDGVAAVSVAIDFVATTYGRGKPDKAVKAECIRLFQTDFRKLNPEEIREAYRQFSLNEIKPTSGEMYGGQLTAHSFGRVLSAYSERRKTVHHNFLKAELDAKRESQRKQIEASKQKDYILRFPEILESAKATAATWKDAKAHWYDTLEDKGRIELSNADKKIIFKVAVQLARSEGVEMMQSNALTISNTYRQMEASTDDRAKVISKKLVVFHYFIKNTGLDGILAEIKKSPVSKEKKQSNKKGDKK